MENQHPLISIITPTFNSAKYIGGLIENVQLQECRNFEHLIVDALSTDGTAEIVLSKSGGDTNLRFISEPDRGIYDAMNKGIIQAQGEWIFFLGSDDHLIGPDVLLKIQNAIIESPDADLIYGDVWNEVYNRIYEGEFKINKILGQNICHQCIFFRKTLFEKMGLYEIKYKQNADYQFNLKCWLGGRVVHKYFPITVSIFARGGLSSTLGDKPHAHDFPETIVSETLSGDFSWLRKIEILSQCFRKILIRYPIGVLTKNVFSRPQYLLIKLLAIFWMVLSFPYYIIKVSLKN